MLKVCMVGLGSIGIQHTRNLARVLNGKCTPFTIDALRVINKPLPPDVSGLISTVHTSFDDLPGDYDIAFLNTPTSLHFEHLQQTIKHARHIFIEKPVFDHADYPWQYLPLRNDGVYYVACPLRYHSVIDYIKAFSQSQHVYSVRCICSSFLPDWRPGTDYRECYSASADQGGGVRIDLIHEWDYLVHLFGFPQCVAQFSGTFSGLELTSEDLAVYIARYPDKLISLHLDYFGRAARRELELYVEDDTIIGDLSGQTVRFLNQNRIISLPQSRAEMQQTELSAFFRMVSGKSCNCNPIENAVEVLRVALGAR